jgi:hypothetical protein
MEGLEIVRTHRMPFRQTLVTILEILRSDFGAGVLHRAWIGRQILIDVGAGIWSGSKPWI